jgi:3-oxoacyl-[acyl-carrier-protein] synthase II
MTAGTDTTPPPVSVLGIGAVTPLGRDVAAMAQKLSAPAVADAPTRNVSDEWLTDPRAGGRLRRADRFTRMAVVAALDAVEAARTDFGDSSGPVGLILATGLGPHVRTFRFLDGILDFGDSSALPTDFSHSVHNAAAAYIAELTALRGQTCTITDFETGFEQAILLAQCWLAAGSCARVLVGAVDELGAVMLNMTQRVLSDIAVRPGEGAVFLALGPADRAGCAQIDATATPAAADLLIVDQPPILPPTAAPWAQAIDARQTTTFTPYFGHLPSSSALATLGGLLSLRHRRALGSLVHAEAGHTVVDRAVTLKRLWSGQTSTLGLANSRI